EEERVLAELVADQGELGTEIVSLATDLVARRAQKPEDLASSRRISRPLDEVRERRQGLRIAVRRRRERRDRLRAHVVERARGKREGRDRKELLVERLGRREGENALCAWPRSRERAHRLAEDRRVRLLSREKIREDRHGASVLRVAEGERELHRILDVLSLEHRAHASLVAFVEKEPRRKRAARGPGMLRDHLEERFRIRLERERLDEARIALG